MMVAVGLVEVVNVVMANVVVNVVVNVAVAAAFSDHEKCEVSDGHRLGMAVVVMVVTLLMLWLMLLMLWLMLWLRLRLRLFHVDMAFMVVVRVYISAIMPVTARRSILKIKITFVAVGTGSKTSNVIMKRSAASTTAYNPKRHRTWAPHGLRVTSRGVDENNGLETRNKTTKVRTIYGMTKSNHSINAPEPKKR